MDFKKKIFVCGFTSLILFGASAYESKAKVTMEGNIVSETKEKGEDAEYNVMNLDPITDRSKNKVTVDLEGAITGAHFELTYLVDGSAKAEDGWSVSARNTYLWFKPLDMLKVKVGYCGEDSFFVERIDSEKVGNPFSISSRGAANNGVPEYITNADVDDMGISLTVNPIENLSIGAAVAPGVDTAFSSTEENTEYKSWGATARYDFNSLIFEAAFRDNGGKSWKVARAGAGYESDNLYAFADALLGIEYVSEKDEYQSNGICFDLYGEYSIESLKFTAHLPVTVRLTGKETDPSYIEYLVKAEYNTGSHGLLDDVTPYITVKSFENPVILDDNLSDSINSKVQLGTSFNVSECSVDVGFSLDIHNEYSDSEKVTWSVPFSMSVEF